CPRRSFIGALILASKFLQERQSSNRRWALLSGYTLTEIGHFEREVGSALGWRLWV
ncbi:hypothetical protein FA13DRAFT_1570778, partial [Coprinellus micaceus]